MKYKLSVTVLLLVFFSALQFAKASVNDESSPTLKAIVPADNDITPGSSPDAGQEAVPAIVNDEINSIVYADFKSVEKNECGTEDCQLKIEDMYGSVFRIKAPTGLDLYVFEEIGPMGWSNYYFIFYDAKSGKLTKKPAYIYGKWLDMFFEDKNSSLLKRPFVSFTEIDGNESIIIEDYGHNGTVYNAVIYRYFRINDDLSLTPILAFEERALWPLEIDGSYRNTIVRKLQFTGKKSAEISTYLNLTKNEEPLYLGKITIEMTDKGQFKIVKKNYIDKKYEFALVTLSETDEQQFIIGGDSLFY